MSMWQTHFDSILLGNQEEPVIKGKRSRVALACQRCKTRKQKCDGTRPCKKCEENDAECEYVVPQRPMPFGKNHYIKLLERRIAELESTLASRGIAEPSSDHWKSTPPNVTPPIHAEIATLDHGSHRSNFDGVLEEPDEAVLDWRDGVDTVVSVLRSLSLDVNGSGYMGASSHVSLGRLFTFIDHGKRPPGYDLEPPTRRTSFQTSVATSGPSLLPASTEEPIAFSTVPSETAERLFSGYLKHVATRFPVVYTVWGRDVHQRRHALTDVFEVTILHLIYATAGRFLETTGESGDFQVKRHYASASRPLDTVLKYNDSRTIQALMLMAIYSLREPGGPGAWACSRTALLIAIEHGLHRQTKTLGQRSMTNELRKRLFWACYAFDRQISVPMGRPFGISDRDIDVDLPLDIDEDTTEEQLLALKPGINSSFKNQQPTSMTSFIHITRLRQIESDIQQTIYRVDNTTSAIEDSVVDEFLARLDTWKEAIPKASQHFRDMADVPFDGYDYYLVFYHKCQRLLLYPQISKEQVNPRFLKLCARACAGVCRAYMRLHQNLAVGYSFMALQTVFMAGLTLVYCIWIAPDEILDMATSSGIHDCSIVLFVIAERVQSAAKYRNAFEVIRQQVIDQIADAPPSRRRRPREAVAGLTAELAPSAQSFELNMPFEVDDGNWEQFSQIITHMTGEDFTGQMNPFGTSPSDVTQAGRAEFNFDSAFGSWQPDTYL